MGKKNVRGILRRIFIILALVLVGFLSFIMFKAYQALSPIYILEHYAAYSVSLLPKFILIVVLYIVFKLLITIVERLFLRLNRLFISQHRVASLKKLIRFFWWSLYILASATIAFGNFAAILTSIGLIGLGLTFALQKPILNFVGWLTIIVKDIYSEGDRIRINTTRGDVKEIQLMNTVIYSLLENSDVRSHKIVTIPNELVLTTDVENYTKDSNYVLDELVISITYESNYSSAITILETIIRNLIRKNVKTYINRRTERKTNIEYLLRKIKPNEERTISKQALEKQKDELQKEIDTIDKLGDDFKPKIRVELADSSIQLIAQFLSPYNSIKRNRTTINLAFLDAIAKENDIEIAYPHMEIVNHQKKK